MQHVCLRHGVSHNPNVFASCASFTFRLGHSLNTMALSILLALSVCHVQVLLLEYMALASIRKMHDSKCLWQASALWMESTPVRARVRVRVYEWGLENLTQIGSTNTTSVDDFDALTCTGVSWVLYHGFTASSLPHL